MSHLIRPPRYPYTFRADLVNWSNLIAADAAQLTQGTVPNRAVLSPVPDITVSSNEPSTIAVEDLPTSFAFGAFDDSNTPVTWPTGHDISVVLVPAGMGYAHFVRDSYAAIKKVNLVGAFKLKLVSHEGQGLDDADMTIGWSLPGANTPTAKPVNGNVQVTTAGPADDQRIVSAIISLNPDAHLSSGFVPYGWGATLLHQLLHALGAGHCSDELQIMHPSTGVTGDLGTGDIYIVKMLAEAARQRADRDLSR